MDAYLLENPEKAQEMIIKLTQVYGYMIFVDGVFHGGMYYYIYPSIILERLSIRLTLYSYSLLYIYTLRSSSRKLFDHKGRRNRTS